MERTAILIFGAFNPVTNAHVMLGKKLKSEYPDADIMYVPSNASYIKDWKHCNDDLLLTDVERYLLLREVMDSNNFITNAIELSNLVSGKTFDTVQQLKKHIGSVYTNIIICMGSDKLTELHTWYMAKELVEENKFIIIERDGIKLDNVINKCDDLVKNNRDHFTSLVNDDCKGISSTAVRKAFKDSKLYSIKNDVPEVVYNYLFRLKYGW